MIIRISNYPNLEFIGNIYITTGVLPYKGEILTYHDIKYEVMTRHFFIFSKEEYDVELIVDKI
jgi:hypothetical protein